MRPWLVTIFLLGCRATPPLPAQSPASTDAPPLEIPALPPEEPQTATRSPTKREVAVRIFKTSPTACDPMRTHVPCMYKGETWCMFYDGEHADEPIACLAETVPALVHRVRVCLDVQDIQPGTALLLFHEDETEPQVVQPTKARRVRLCSTADRMWRVEIDGRRGTLDWTKTTCHTLDARTLRLRLGCDEPFDRIPVEDYL